MITKLGLRKILDVVTTLEEYDGGVVKLFKEDITLTPDVVPGDLVEADFTGYAPVAATAGTIAWDDSNGNAVVSFPGVHFQPTGTATTNTIYGYWIASTLDAVNSVILRIEKFDTPIPMASPADAIDLIVRYAIGQPVAPVGEV